jgi:hypothetical protein
MNVLIVYPTKNQIKNDATGAFIPEAVAFKIRRQALGDFVDEFKFDPHNFSKGETFRLYQALEFKPYQIVAVFSHGIPTCLTQLHIDRARCNDFAMALTRNLMPTHSLNLILYCCLLAAPLKGSNIAETLTRELHAIGKPFKLWAHRTKGHTTENPNITMFEGNLSLDYPSALGDPLLVKRFKQRLDYDTRKPGDVYRFDYPFELPIHKPGVFVS